MAIVEEETGEKKGREEERGTEEERRTLVRLKERKEFQSMDWKRVMEEYKTFGLSILFTDSLLLLKLDLLLTSTLIKGGM
jgi:hypothetical protein